MMHSVLTPYAWGSAGSRPPVVGEVGEGGNYVENNAWEGGSTCRAVRPRRTSLRSSALRLEKGRHASHQVALVRYFHCKPAESEPADGQEGGGEGRGLPAIHPPLPAAAATLVRGLIGPAPVHGGGYGGGGPGGGGGLGRDGPGSGPGPGAFPSVSSSLLAMSRRSRGSGPEGTAPVHPPAEPEAGHGRGGRPLPLALLRPPPAAGAVRASPW